MRRLLITALAALVVLAVFAQGAGAQPRGNDCEPFSDTPCLLPFPNDLFTVHDASTPTGRRVHLLASAMPVNAQGSRISVEQYDRNDGFSPGSAIVVRVPGLDTPAALARTGAVPITDLRQAYAPRAPVAVIDARTGRRQLIWAELDANAPTPADTNLLIHPARNLLAGHRYVVALRELRDAQGRLLATPRWFELLRDHGPLPGAMRGQRGRYARIFGELRRAGLDRRKLYMAWDFTVASRQSLSARLLHIRNDAFARLGDHELGDGQVAGRAPAFQVTSVEEPSVAQNPRLLRIVKGTVDVPCYLDQPDCPPGARFHYSSAGPDALPTQMAGNVVHAPFECIVPRAAALSPARASLYGHGLLGDPTEVEAGNVQAMAAEHNVVFCATQWFGLSSDDLANDAVTLQDLNSFPTIADRLQQGVLDALYLGRLMIHPHGLVSSPAFRVNGHAPIDTTHLFYDGNSLGGIMGGITTAVSPDFTRAVLGVPGMDFGNVLLTRSSDFTPFANAILNPAYPDASLRPLTLDIIQMLWDRGEADGYAQWMTSHPLPHTPAHTVLIHVAFGDFQVANIASEVEARTIGAFAQQPALDPGRSLDRTPLFGIPTIPSYPWPGSAIVYWDSGPGRVPPPPTTNTPPTQGDDPHEDPRSTPAAREQKSRFLQAGGAVVDVCGGQPCHTSVFTP